jgi:hypothetical protein
LGRIAPASDRSLVKLERRLGSGRARGYQVPRANIGATSWLGGVLGLLQHLLQGHAELPHLALSSGTRERIDVQALVDAADVIADVALRHV